MPVDSLPALQALHSIISPAVDAVNQLADKANLEIEQLTERNAALTKSIDTCNTQITALTNQVESLKTQLANVPLPQPYKVTGLTDIHLHGDWQMVVQPDVAPMNDKLVKGTDYGFRSFQKLGGSNSAIELFFNKAIVGDYSGFLIAIHRDMENVAKSRLFWKGRFYHDDRALNGMQALEFDTRLSKDNLNYNLSSQINYAKGGVLQLVNDASGNTSWQDTSIILGKPAPGKWHDFMWEYSYDTTAKTFGYDAFVFDGKRYPIIEGKFVTQVATKPDWGVPFRAHVQLQIGTNNKGLPFSVAFDKLTYYFL